MNEMAFHLRYQIDHDGGLGNSDVRLSYVVADPTVPGPWLEAVKEADAVIHLAGAGVFDRRWTDSYKQVIRDSRVNSTAVLAAALAVYPLAGRGVRSAVPQQPG